LNIQIYDFNGAAGTGWDLLTSTGGMTVSSTSQYQSSSITINVVFNCQQQQLRLLGNALNFTKGLQLFSKDFNWYIRSLVSTFRNSQLLVVYKMRVPVCGL
jgi:hypothetical protein